MSEFSNQGQVSETSTKEWYDNKKGRNINLYSFRIEGNNRWFRTGTNEPNFRQGDFITFTNDDKNNVRLENVQVGNAPAGNASAPPQSAATTAQRQSSGSTGGGGQNRDGYWAAKEAKDIEKDARYQTQDVPRMSFSAAQDRAVNLVAAALAHDCLSFGTMKKGDKLDYVLQCVDQVSNRFFLNAMYAPERLVDLEDDSQIDAVMSGESEVAGEASYE